MAGRISWMRGIAIAAAAGIVSASAGWVASDRLERNNDFCNACHLASGRPLHAGIRRDFDAGVPASLAAAHAAAPGERPFRCIDCHGGTSWLGRARVKALAAKDAFWYVVGDFSEPDQMRWPLWDEDCSRCHDAFDTRDSEPWKAPRFHQLPVHNTALGVACVECHAAHDAAVDARANFLHAPSLKMQCARCHPEFEEGER